MIERLIQDRFRLMNRPELDVLYTCIQSLRRVDLRVEGPSILDITDVTKFVDDAMMVVG